MKCSYFVSHIVVLRLADVVLKKLPTHPPSLVLFKLLILAQQTLLPVRTQTEQASKHCFCGVSLSFFIDTRFLGSKKRTGRCFHAEDLAQTNCIHMYICGDQISVGALLLKGKAPSFRRAIRAQAAPPLCALCAVGSCLIADRQLWPISPSTEDKQ